MEDNIQTLLRQAHAASPECCPLDDDAVLCRCRAARASVVRRRRRITAIYTVAVVAMLLTCNIVLAAAPSRPYGGVARHEMAATQAISEIETVLCVA